jgi:uncharacterized protein YbaR (Trm112 family)
MSEIRNFEIFFYNDLLICPDCSKNFKLHKQVYNIDGIPYMFSMSMMSF